MWQVNVNGAWQPAQSEGQIHDWVRRGYVGPNTLIQHASWPHPIPLAQVPNFAGVFRMGGAAPNRGVGGIDGRTWLRIGSFTAAFIALVVLGSGDITQSYVFIGLGLCVVALVIVCRKISPADGFAELITTWVWGRRLDLLVWAAAFFVGGGIALARHRSTVQECGKYFTEFTTLKNESLSYEDAMKRFDTLTADAETGHKVCLDAEMPTDAAALTAAQEELNRQKSAAQQKARDDANAQLAANEKASAEEHERNAVASFPSRIPDIRTQLASASKKADGGDWLGSNDALDTARSALQEFAGTSVESSDDWIALSKRADTIDARIAPGLARLQAQANREQAQAEQKAQADEAVDSLRGPKPERWFDGCCFECREYLKQAMNDPDSYECVGSSEPQVEGAYWTTVMSFRGTNAFGAKVVNRQKFFIQHEQVVKTADY